MSINQNRGKDLMIGAIVGGLFGAVTALLLAPKTGRELRAGLSYQYENLNEKTQQFAGELSQKTQQIASDVGHKTQEIVRNVSAQTTEIVDKAKEAVGSVAGEVRAWRESNKDTAVTAESQEQKLSGKE